MTLEDKINGDIKKAMIAKEKEQLEALRAVKAAILLEKTAKKGQEITEEMELKLLQKLVKQRRESSETYRNADRAELDDKEDFQAEIIQKYLPEQLSEEDIKAAIKEIIVSSGATSMKDMGRVMGQASKKLAGKADNKMIAALVKQMLS